MDSDDCIQDYEPDCEQIDSWREEQSEFEAFRVTQDKVRRELCDYNKYTDRQLRNLYRDGKARTHDLWRHYQYDVASDCFEVLLEDGETQITLSRDGRERSLTRIDKRRMKKHARSRGRRWLRKRPEVDFGKRRGEIPCGSQRLGRQELLLPAVAAT